MFFEIPIYRVAHTDITFLNCLITFINEICLFNCCTIVLVLNLVWQCLILRNSVRVLRGEIENFALLKPFVLAIGAVRVDHNPANNVQDTPTEQERVPEVHTHNTANAGNKFMRVYLSYLGAIVN